MARADFDNMNDGKDFTPLPDGVYKVRVGGAEESLSQAGNEMITLTLDVIDGEFTGRKIWDRLVFTPNMMWKIKHVCEELGLPVTGQVELTPSMFVGCEVMVEVETEESDGYKPKNVVTARGYTSCTPAGDSPAEEKKADTGLAF